MLKQIVMGLVMVAATLAAPSGAEAQCEQKKCHGGYNLPESSGNNQCYTVQVAFTIHSGDPCVWNGSACVGDPCTLEWSVLVILNPSGPCDESDCVQRLRAEHTNCGATAALEQFTPSPATPTYFKSGSETLNCGCSYEIAVSLNVPVPTSDPCVGGFKYSRSVTCSECKLL